MEVRKKLSGSRDSNAQIVGTDSDENDDAALAHCLTVMERERHRQDRARRSDAIPYRSEPIRIVPFPLTCLDELSQEEEILASKLMNGDSKNLSQLLVSNQ